MNKLILLLFCGLCACGQPQTGPQGPAGATGPQGQPGSSTTVLELCPNIPGGDGFPEYLLVEPTGVYGVYYTGNDAHLAKLVSGSYVTTDGRNCAFTLTTNNTISYPKQEEN